MKALLAASIALLLATFLPSVSSAQCSDAGVCSIGGMERDELPIHVSLGYGFGSSGDPDDITFHSVQFEAGALVLPGSRLTVQLPWVVSDGPLGSASGIGDVTVLWDQRIFGDYRGWLSLQVGGKFATGAVNEGDLPQAYQPGLGTNDLLLGAAYTYDSWLVAVGYQLAGGRSDNKITRLERGDDLLGRIGYSTDFEEFDLGLEVLAIKRLSESSVQDPTRPAGDVFVTVPDSDHFQVNLMGTASYPLGQRLRLNLLAALPLLQRDVNLDGRKRSLTLGVGARYRL